jgi:transcriptional regulator with XRE-family HTH domain
MKRKQQNLSPFARWLTQIADESDLSLTALANKAGIAPGTLRYLVIEPERKPSLATCLRLSTFTGRPVEEILTLAGNPTDSQIDLCHPDRLRLLSIFESLPPAGRTALLTVAETVGTAMQSHPTHKGVQ